jgi:predicted DNA-binding protein with PD1-like motif
MDSVKVHVAGEYVGRFPHGCELIGELGRFADEKCVDSAVFHIIGAAKSARLAFYDQTTLKYGENSFDEPLEIVHCSGNIAYKDGKRFVHAHILLSREDGSTIGGHLISADVFAAELYLRAFKEPITRSHDATTGLQLMALRSGQLGTPARITVTPNANQPKKKQSP